MFISLAAVAQNDKLDTEKSGKNFEYQIGINATSFIKSFIVLNNNSIASNGNVPQFALNYKMLYNKQQLSENLRYGLRLGGTYTSSENGTASDGNVNNTKALTFAARVGIELQQKVSKRLVVYYGIDYLMNSSNQENVSSFQVFTNVFQTTTTTQTNSAKGLGPIVGFQFNINKYMNVSTEASLYFINGQGESKSVSTRTDGQPINNQSPTASSLTQSTIALPNFINFNIVF